jgi:hypothetical protein
MASYIVADRKQAQGVYPATRVRSSKGLVGELVGPSRRFSNFPGLRSTLLGVPSNLGAD